MILDIDFRRVKLIDFGMTRKCGSYVRRLLGSIPYSPPEVCDTVNSDILVSTAMDVWAFGVLLFSSLTGIEKQKRILFVRIKIKQKTKIILGNFPWEHAQETDIYYNEYIQWHRHHQLQHRYTLPSQWLRFSSRLMRLFRKILGK